MRPATAADAGWLADVSRALHQPGLRDYMIVAQPGIGRYWEVVLDHPASFPGRCLLVAEGESGELLGFADLVLVEPEVAHLSYLCVAEAARGRGVASVLLREYLARNPGVRTMQLDVFADNAPARALYDRIGFEVDSATTWWIADIAQQDKANDENVRVEGLHAACAWLETYGFCELSVATPNGTVRLGRPSARVLRCFDVGTLQRPAVLSAVIREFPEIDRVLVLAPGHDVPRSAVGELRAVDRALRMSTHEIRTILEHA